MTTGENIRKLRKKMGLTQKELAERMQTSESLISQYEKGIKKPRIETSIRIANALGVSVYSIVDFDTASNLLSDDITENEKEYGAHFYDLMRWFTALNEAGQLEAVKRLSELAELPRYQKSDEQKEGAEHGKA